MSRRRIARSILQLPSANARNFLASSTTQPTSGNSSPFSAKVIGKQRLLDWDHDYVRLFNSILDEFDDDDALDETYFDIIISGIFEDGLVTATIPQRGGDIRLFVNRRGTGGVTMGCTCSVSGGSRPCVHILSLLDDITEELGDSYSGLSQRVLQATFDRDRPNLEAFRPSIKSHIAELLKGLRLAEEERLQADDIALVPIEERSLQRVAWNIEITQGRVAITPLLQQPKKRGGWGKGRKIALQNLQEHREWLTPADERVRNLIRIGSDYYRPSFHLDSVAAIQELIGASNVLLQGAEATIERFDGALRLHRDTNSCWLALDAGVSGLSNLVLAHDCLVHIRADLGRVQVCSMNPAQLSCLRATLKFPRVPLAHEAELLDAVVKMQNVLTIHLPESLAGKVVDETYTPTLLLRSRRDGSLDYGVRLRGSSGKLVKPGVGRMLIPQEQNGERVQLKRSAVHEQRIAEEIILRLGLPAGRIEGSVADFESALSLIESIQVDEPTGSLEVLWDKDSEKPLKMLGALSSKNVSVGITRKRDWFQLTGNCQIGNQSIELAEFLSGLQATGEDSIRGDFIRLGDHGWAKISQDLRDQFQQLHDSVNQERGTLKFDATSAPALRDLLNGQIDLNASRAWNECLSRLDRAEKLEPKLPTSLNAELRDYQLDGFKWLRRLAEWGVGGILADDMGLGKTLQMLAVIMDRAHQGPTLVIAPTSVGFNWVREAEKFTPQLVAHLYRETDRTEFLQSIGPGSLVVCSYGLALRDAEQLSPVAWTTLVLDEAQAIKNSRSKTSLAIAGISADWKVALTGTPVENHLGELWSLFRVVSPGVLGGWDQFRRRFAGPIEKDNDEQRRIALRDRLKPFLLRRTKEQVLNDLPPRTEMNLYVELNADERDMYDQVRKSAIGEVDQIAKLSDVKDQRFRILALLTRLRQLACSPQLVHENWEQRSSKLQLLLETVRDLRDEGHRVLIFSQFVQHLTLIRKMLDEEKITYEYLDGSTSAKARQVKVDSFQNGQATAFLISLKAGGTGLNLTAADYVIHMDPWWNPAVEDQATDRAHRMGQDKPVMVYRLVSQGTIEEEILKLHDTKRDLVAGVMEGTAAAGKLSTEDLMSLLRS